MKKTLHHLSPYQKMEMVGHEAPCKAGGLGLEKELGEVVKEAAAVLVIEKDVSLLDDPDHDVMQQSNDIEAS